MTQPIAKLLQSKPWPEVVFLCGEAFLRMEALRQFRNFARKHEILVSETACSAAPGGDASADIFDDLRGGSLFAEEKFILVHPADKFVTRYKKFIERYLVHPATGNILVLSIDKAPAGKTFREHAKLLKYNKLYPNQIPAWLIDFAADLDLSLPPACTRLLVELLGDNLFKLSSAVQKLAGILPAGTTVRTDQILSMIGADRGAGFFELQDTLLAGEARQCLQVLGRYTHPEMTMAIAGLARTWRQMRNIKVLAAAGIGQSDIAAKLKMHPFVVRKHITAVKHKKIDELDQKLRLCREADCRLKSGGKNPRHIAESLALQLCQQQI
ncbi:DNA polymerase III subunit delta [Planctomycetota bacterium]